MNTPRKRATYARNQTAASRIEEQTAMISAPLCSYCGKPIDSCPCRFPPTPPAQPMTAEETVEEIRFWMRRRESINNMGRWIKDHGSRYADLIEQLTAARQSWEVERAQLRKDCADWAQRFQDADAAKDDLLEVASAVVEVASAGAKARKANEEMQRKNKNLAANIRKVRQTHREVNEALGKWLSAALDDPTVCAEMKADITAWFDSIEEPTDV